MKEQTPPTRNWVGIRSEGGEPEKGLPDGVRVGDLPERFAGPGYIGDVLEVEEFGAAGQRIFIQVGNGGRRILILVHQRRWWSVCNFQKLKRKTLTLQCSSGCDFFGYAIGLSSLSRTANLSFKFQRTHVILLGLPLEFSVARKSFLRDRRIVWISDSGLFFREFRYPTGPTYENSDKWLISQKIHKSNWHVSKFKIRMDNRRVFFYFNIVVIKLILKIYLFN